MSRPLDPGPDADVVARTEGTWPAALSGVTESVVSTRGPNGRWNVAALGLHAPDVAADGDDGDDGDGTADATEAVDDPVTATTWGNTRTRRNFHRRGGGVVQFTSDPREFVDAALTVREEPDPVLDGADAWVAVDARQIEAGEDGGTRRERWALSPGAGVVRRERVPTINRGSAAVVEATVAASRLDVPTYDAARLRARLHYFAETVERCGGPAEREAFARIDAATGWREDAEGEDERF